MRTLPLLLLLLVLALPARAAELPLQELLDRSVPLVEAELGATLVRRPTIREATREELAAVLTAEFAPQVRSQLPGAPDEEVARVAAEMGQLYSGVLIGKYDPTGAILIVRENLEALGGPQEALLRATVVHEVVHALDDQEVGVFQDLGSRDDLEVWNALAEGHAQYVTRRVLAAAGEEDVFTAFEEHITRMPEGLGAGERYILGLMSHSFRFAYVDGRHFFERLPREYHREVFVTPPASKSQILHPEQYLEQPVASPTFDVGPLWTALEATRPEGWTGGRRVGDESALRAAFGEMLDPARVEPVVARIRASHFLASQAPGGTAVAAYGVYETDSPEAAAEFLALQEALSRAKDEKMTSGMIRVVSATYRPVEVPGADCAFHVEKRVEAMGQPLLVRSAIGAAGPFVLEVLHSGPVPGDVEADLGRMVELLGRR